ncbi:hypothetical protein NKI46_05055 [Mesorhizobium sp. M0615]|uniref:hypothetical protein n=1 Tax=Mesorhizobium sp. M0615 TaxID=2956971 RepID=UPI003336AFF7
MPSYTIQDLYQNGRDTIFRNLIMRAIKKEKVYYSDLADVLSNIVVDGIVSDQRIGGLVGTLMSEIWRIYPEAPPINMLVISKKNKTASKGSDSFLKRYFRLSRVPSARRKSELAQIAVGDVWDFSSWQEIYNGLTGQVWTPVAEGGVQDFDDDGQGDNPKYGGLPESAEHKKLKAYVVANPSSVGLKQRPLRSQPESLLLSGDEIDVEFTFKKKRVAVEVKSIKSGESDLVRGVYQCVKYRAVLNAQYSPDGVSSHAILVTEKELPSKVASLARRLNVKTFVVRVNI